jgi:hypothetical protein
MTALDQLVVALARAIEAAPHDERETLFETLERFRLENGPVVMNALPRSQPLAARLLNGIEDGLTGFFRTKEAEVLTN